VSGAHRRDHAIPVLRVLRWLPVGQRVIFKTAVLVWNCIQGVAPVYLQQLCTQADSICGRPTLRSVSVGCIRLPREKQRSFALNGLAVGNSLPGIL